MENDKKSIAVGSDMKSPVVDAVVEYLKGKGYRLDTLVPGDDTPIPWPSVGEHVGEAVGSGRCAQGVLFCWTGTGVSMAANKVPGVRAALCGDAQTATGARRWNDANVVVMSLRATSEALAREILDAWFEAKMDTEDAPRVEELNRIDEKHRGPSKTNR